MWQPHHRAPSGQWWMQAASPALVAACNSDDAQAQCFAAGAIGNIDPELQCPAIELPAVTKFRGGSLQAISSSHVHRDTCLHSRGSRQRAMLTHGFPACAGKLVNFGGEPAHLLLQAQAPSALMTMLEGTKPAAPVSSSLTLPAHCSACMWNLWDVQCGSCPCVLW